MSQGSSSCFKHAKLQVRDRERVIQTLTLQVGKTYLIGRHSQVSIRLDSPLVSRRHASLELRPDGVHLTDLGSANGVVLAGEQAPIAPGIPQLLKSEQKFGICDYTLEVRLVGFSSSEADETKLFVSTLSGLDRNLQVIGQMGSGSVGSVWACTDMVNQRRVAVKVMHRFIEPDSMDGQRFRQEAQLCQRVTSFNVVKIFDVRLIDNRPMIVMELINGPSAKERMRDCKDQLPLQEALSIGRDIARGLVAVAAAGLVHRDVKPSNILIGPAGSKLSDFGLAKHLGGPSITESGFGMGTVAYVAPEQAMSAKDVDVRADIYGLGATLYHLLSGSPPFQPQQPYPDLFKAIKETPPSPIRERRPELPEEVSRLVHAMLAKEPDDRPDSAAEVLFELKRILLGLPPSPGEHDTGRLHL